MKTINAIIVDDEKHVRESLSSLLKIYCPEVNLLGDAGNLEDAKLAIEKLNPDLVFLDIAIGEENGFDLIEELKPVNFQVIFTTAFSEYALKAFRVNAIDYLLKPIDPTDLKAALQKVSNNSNTNQIQEQLTNLFESIQTQKVEKIGLSSLDGITFIELDQIVYIVGSGNYSTFYLLNGEKITSSKSLKHFEDILPKSNFYRSHQSYLVNLSYVEGIKTGDGVVELIDKNEVALSKSRKEGLLARMKRGCNLLM